MKWRIVVGDSIPIQKKKNANITQIQYNGGYWIGDENNEIFSSVCFHLQEKRENSQFSKTKTKKHTEK